MSEHRRVDVHDVDREADPLVNGPGLAVRGARQVAVDVVDEARLPLEPGVDPPHNPKDDAKPAHAPLIRKRANGGASGFMSSVVVKPPIGVRPA